MIFPKFIIAGLLLASAVTAVAQEKSSSSADTTSNLSEVVVTATRKASPLATMPFSISVLNKQQMNEFQYRSTPEALMSVPGVFVQKTNHGGGSAFIRGLTGNQTLILIDGIRLNNAIFRYGPNQYLNTIDHFAVDHVEVVKGSGSVQYGSDAMGGVIQLLTIDPAYSVQSNVKGKIIGRYWNGNMEKTGRGQLVYSAQKFAASGGVSVKQFGALIGGDTTGKQSPSGYNEVDADIKLKWKVSNKVELIGAHQFVKQSNVPVYHKLKLENFLVNEMELQQRTLSYLKLNVDNTNLLYNKISFTSSFQQSAERRLSQKNKSITLRKERDEVSTSNFSADIHSLLATNWTANSGFEYYFDKVNSYKEDINTINKASVHGRGLYPNQATYANASLYSLHHLQFGSLNIEGGVRYNWFNVTIPEQTLGLVKVKPSTMVLNAGVNYGMGINHLYALFSSGYRAPNIDDMGTLGIVDFRYELPSFNLKPERNYNTEIGYKLQANNLKGSLALFYNKLTNLITRVKSGNEVIDGYNVYRKENIERAFIKGGEAFVQWLPTKHFTVNSFTAYTFGNNNTNNEPLRRMPPLNGNTSIKYALNRYYLIAELAWATDQNRLAQGDKDDNRIPLGGTPGWQVLNAFAGYQYKKLQFRLSLQNLFNKDYRTHGSGINGVGQSVLMEMNISL